MFPNKLILIAAALHAGAAWSNPTLDHLVEGGTYFSPRNPCAYEVSKDPINYRLILKSVPNPVYWFSGRTAYADPYGVARAADFCAHREKVEMFACNPRLDFCAEGAWTARAFRLLPNGELVETRGDDEVVENRMKLYSAEIASQQACTTRRRAEEAIVVLDDFVANKLEQICKIIVTDDDEEETKKYYSSNCIERYLLPISAPSAASRAWADFRVSIAAFAFYGNANSCQTTVQDSGNRRPSVYHKCAREQLELAQRVLRRMADDATPACAGPQAVSSQ